MEDHSAEQLTQSLLDFLKEDDIDIKTAVVKVITMPAT